MKKVGGFWKLPILMFSWILFLNKAAFIALLMVRNSGKQRLVHNTNMFVTNCIKNVQKMYLFGGSGSGNQCYCNVKSNF